MGEFKIEDNIPIINKRHGGPPVKYPLDKLQVGQSFFAPNVTGLSSRLNSSKLRTGFDFTQNRENGGVRVWRIE